MAHPNNSLSKIDPEIQSIIEKETRRQEDEINLIASENYASQAVMEATGSVLTNKYAEGYPGKRYYGGCQFVDEAETLAIERCKQLFSTPHANVQPHAGCQANIAAYFALLQPGDSILGMSLAAGGHLTHGHGVNYSGKMYKAHQYGVNKETEELDYDEIQKMAEMTKPKLLIVGASAYSRIIDYPRCAAIAKSVGAYLMADVAHIAGLIAAGLHPTSIGHADVTTSTTHKTLRGPRGGLIMCSQELASVIDRGIMPGTQGGPFMQVIAAKAVAFGEALKPSFKAYQQDVLTNARTMATAMQNLGYRIVTGGTDNHLFVVDMRSKKINGLIAETALQKAGITVSRSCIPFDPEKPWVTSGIRIGTPAITTRGMKQKEVLEIVALIDEVINHAADDAKLRLIKEQVLKLCNKFPIQHAR